jgi:hypothetical protein
MICRWFQKNRSLSRLITPAQYRILFQSVRFLERTVFYKITRPRALYGIFSLSYISFTESLRNSVQIVARTPPQQSSVKQRWRSDRFLHSSELLDVPILNFNGCFISSTPTTFLGGKGLIVFLVQPILPEEWCHCW